MSGRGTLNGGVYDTPVSSIVITAGTVDAARRVVAGRAVDAADARNLLDLLGLLPDQVADLVGARP